MNSELFLQLSGCTLFDFPDQSLSLYPGEAVIVPPRVPHVERAIALGLPFRDIVVLADADSLLCHLGHDGEDGRPRVFYTESRQSRVSSSLARWLNDAVAWGRREDQSPLAIGLVMAALSGLMEAFDEIIPGSEVEPRMVGRAKHLIGDRIGDTDLSVASLAGALSCSADYLSHRFRQFTGQGLIEYIHELRIKRAADLLRSTELSSKEIAWACGFSSHSYFIRVFRRAHACSPLGFREASAR
jgi:AraC-like DNA-binding protein